jgi:hypothetical protein
MLFAFSVRDLQRKGKGKTMKKTDASKPNKASDEMLAEYKFDYKRARPNRFASRILEQGVTVTLDPDVSEVFTTSESVNAILRALIETMPRIKARKKAGRQSTSQ